MLPRKARYEMSSAPDIDVFAEVRAVIFTLPLLSRSLGRHRFDFAIPDSILNKLIDLLPRAPASRRQMLAASAHTALCRY